MKLTSEEKTDIISFGDFFRYYTISLSEIPTRYNLHTCQEDEECTDDEMKKEEIIDFLWAHSFCPSKDEILNLHEQGLLLPMLEKMKQEKE